MDLKMLANELVAANKEGRVAALLDAHYAADAASVEAVAMDPERGREVVGLEAIRAKHAWWEDAMEVHDVGVEGPFLHGEDRFAVIFEVDATEKASGRRLSVREVAVYTVADGKVVREEFYGTS